MEQVIEIHFQRRQDHAKYAFSTMASDNLEMQGARASVLCLRRVRVNDVIICLHLGRDSHCY